MKKFLSFLIAAALLLAIVPAQVEARDYVRGALNNNQSIIDNTSDWLTQNRPCSRILKSNCNPTLTEDGYYWLNRGRQGTHNNGGYYRQDRYRSQRSGYYNGHSRSGGGHIPAVLQTVVRVVDRVEARREFESQLEHERRMAQMHSAREAEYVEDGRISEPLAGPSRTSDPDAIFSISNSSGKYIEVYDGTKHLGRMSPRDNWSDMGAPKVRYRGFAVIPNVRGTLSRDEADICVGDTGWTFIRPGAQCR